MRTALCLLLATTMVMAIHQNIVCPPDFCSNVQCSKELTEETCSGEFVPYSSFCECCPTCITYIKPGGYCNDMLNAILGAGNLLTHECSPGFICVRNICSPLLS